MAPIYITRYASLHGALKRLEDGTPVFTLSDADEKKLLQVPNELPKIASLFNRLDRVTQLGLAVTQSTLGKSSPSILGDSSMRTAVIVGSARGATALLEQSITDFYRGKNISSLTSPLTTAGGIASTIQYACGVNTVAIGTSMACASFFESLMIAQSLIATGRIDRALVVGTEAPLTPFTISQMKRLKLYSRDLQSEYPCRPFQSIIEKTNQLVLGEGAACFLLEGEKSLLQSKHQPIVSISGLGIAQELDTSLTGMDEEGVGFSSAMQQALHEANIDAPELVVAHAPGTVVGDSAEQTALEVFSNRPLIFSTKFYTGHTFGASAALSLAAGIEIATADTSQISPLSRVQFDGFLRARGNSGKTINNFIINAAGFGGVVMSAVFSQ